MCGITGFIPLDVTSDISLHEEIKSITQELFHRGPDAIGTWVDEKYKVALGHRRLSILDLSKEGKQPMSSVSEQFIIVFNGEIYNHLLLRTELDEFYSKNKENKKLKWRGTSDTETLLACIQAWGVENTLPKLVGMFAFALWDQKFCSLTIARDRFGEKPLYFGWVENSFVFASELKALKKISDFNNDICPVAMSKYFELKYVPSPLSIYEGIYKLPPSSFLNISYNEIQNKISDLNLFKKIKNYWSLEELIIQNKHNSFLEIEDGTLVLEEALLRAVRDQSLADVELGSFLSGGTDSSLISALLQAQSSSPIKTFTVGFSEDKFDESKYAKKIADYLGTDHHELKLSSTDALNVVPEISRIYDEPFSDSSQIPTFLVSQYASSRVTVALSGDGGDEVFGGYNRYIYGPNLWKKIRLLPLPLRISLGNFISSFNSKNDTRINWVFNQLNSKNYSVNQFSDKLKKLGYGLKTSSDFFGFYYGLVSDWGEKDQLVKFKSSKNSIILDFWDQRLAKSLSKEHASLMMYWDSMTYLPDDILVKVDRASMANSLETRAPFLDHRLSEIAWRFQLNDKIHKRSGKLLLKNILKKYIPEHLTERPKSGFSIPLGEWLRGPLKEWASGLIDESTINTQGHLHFEPISKAWTDHLSGKNDNSHKLWSILMFQSWLEAND
jgi:asparagine synthase (glutamine-hydrolysing)